jgi:hypothetical protein
MLEDFVAILARSHVATHANGGERGARVSIYICISARQALSAAGSRPGLAEDARAALIGIAAVVVVRSRRQSRPPARALSEGMAQ